MSIILTESVSINWEERLGWSIQASFTVQGNMANFQNSEYFHEFENGSKSLSIPQPKTSKQVPNYPPNMALCYTSKGIQDKSTSLTLIPCSPTPSHFRSFHWPFLLTPQAQFHSAWGKFAQNFTYFCLYFILIYFKNLFSILCSISNSIYSLGKNPTPITSRSCNSIYFFLFLNIRKIHL